MNADQEDQKTTTETRGEGKLTTDKHGWHWSESEIGKSKPYRGFTQMSADREKAKPTTEARRRGEQQEQNLWTGGNEAKREYA